jgi:phytoene dehydrogenase-like protein
MEKSIIIIGAGLAGLSAGSYAQMNGYRTSIFEMHDKSGGVCTGWKRKGYTIDGAMHWLVGTRPGKVFHSIWQELGALQGKTVINHDQYVRYEGDGGKVFTVYADIDRLQHHMGELAPEDRDAIADFIKAVRACARIDMPVEKAPELYGLVDGIKMIGMLPNMGFMRKWSNISTADYVRRFKNPFLREALSEALAAEMPDFPMFFMLMTFAWLHGRMAGYPLGGCLGLVQSIEQRYLGLGGSLHLGARVDTILVEDDRAVGIRLADGSEHRADTVISAADGHTTIFKMLDGKYVDGKVRAYYDQPRLFPPLLYVGIGVARTFGDLTSSVAGLSFPLESPATIAGKEHRRIGVQVYNFDPTLAPAGKTVLKVQFNTDYDYWTGTRALPGREGTNSRPGGLTSGPAFSWSGRQRRDARRRHSRYLGTIYG